ncbi:alpha/beta fold hydrolase [Hymenobacter terricola]|uniref:alpha/beta fold hydrolase n=1 Tax=Hymenobacter terricola TaxID=2819236 RepID=UPI001B30A498|nr:alpha/beta hydrolase [Hymenobacter terricola]
MKYKKARVNELDIFYRETGDPTKPTILLLHGFPTSSFMYRELMRDLEDRYHLVAPDYPGFGQSSFPSVTQYEYTFDNLATLIENFVMQLGIKKMSIYVMDYGAPVGFRIAAHHPEWIDALIVQNGNAYDEGLETFWDPIKAYWKDNKTPSVVNKIGELFTFEKTYWQYANGMRDVESLSPDTYTLDQALLDRPGNDAVQYQLFTSYGSNPPLYPAWQAYFREHKPPMLITWGKNDYVFPPSGAHPYLRDLPNAELHLLDTGHFVLEEEHKNVAQLIDAFLTKNVSQAAPKQVLAGSAASQ